MMTKTTWRALALVAAATAGTLTATALPERRRHPFPDARNGNVVVGLCDGETSMELPGVAPGRPLPRGRAQGVADALMLEWRRRHPNVGWEEPVALAQGGPEPKPAPISPARTAPAPSPVSGQGESAATGARQAPSAQSAHVQSGHTYGNFSARDQAIWTASTREFIERGRKVFHDAKELGGTVGISCDMCHPDGANTHPETYPKYQVQLGRVALLRDMINWCLENPVRGKPLPDDDDRLRAIEGYLYAQRKGFALEFGKH
jgi:thiosulfate dehydrogenase